MRPFCLAFWLSAVSLLSAQTGARAQFEGLARHIPSSANAVAFVNVEKLMDSPVAKREKWSERRDAAYGSGISFLPPDSKQAVLALHMDLPMWLPLWEAAILNIDHEPSMEQVVTMTGGTADSVVGRSAVALAEDA